MSNRLRGFFFSLLTLFLVPLPVSAQSAVQLKLSAPETNSFPQIEAYLDVQDAEGNFIYGLQASQVHIMEDGQPASVGEIDQLRPGAQVVFALNPGPALGVRDSKGFSRYDYIKESISAWANSRLGSTLDDLSLLITESTSLSHISDPQIFLSALETDLVDPRNAVPDLDILFRAVDLAADSTPRPGMGRAVYFVTPPIEGEITQPLENLIAQANLQDIHVHILVISTIEDFPTMGIQRLMDLASQTGGELFAYTGEEVLPDPEDFLAPLRHIYRITYNSNVTSSGAYSLVVQVQFGVEQVESNSQVFEIDIRPPVPAFVSPPHNIERIPPPETVDEEQVSFDHYLPGEQSLQVVYDFPDGRKRPLMMSALIVDGVVVDQNNQPPFDTFSWSLSQYETDGIHQIQVQTEDALGLVGTSIELPVQITIVRPRPNPWKTFQDNLPAIVVLVVVLSGAVLLLALVLSGRIHPRPARIARRGRKSGQAAQPAPVSEERATRNLPGWVNRLHWPQRSAAPKAFAFLHYMPENEDMPPDPPIPITTNEITLGSDPHQATIVLSDQSVEGLHARMVREEGSFILADEGSIAGTWINYTPVSQAGTLLVHGDLINIGRLGFRFALRKPTQVRKPMVVLLNDSQEIREEAFT